MINIELENSFKRYLLNGDLVLFAGAGFSINSYNKSNIRLPISSELKKELLSMFLDDSFDSLPLEKLCTIIEKQSKQDFIRYLKSRLFAERFDKGYSEVTKFNYEAIITTNVDNLFEIIYAENKVDLVDVNIYGDTNITGTKLYKIHGSITYPINDDMTFSVQSIFSAIDSNRDALGYIHSLLNRRPFLFWGYGLNDVDTLNVLLKARLENYPKWIIIPPLNNANAIRVYFESLGLKIIVASAVSKKLI